MIVTLAKKQNWYISKKLKLQLKSNKGQTLYFLLDGFSLTMCNVLRYTQVDVRHASAGMKINGDVTSASTESLHISSWKIYFSASFICIQIGIAPPDG